MDSIIKMFLNGSPAVLQQAAPMKYPDTLQGNKKKMPGLHRASLPKTGKACRTKDFVARAKVSHTCPVQKFGQVMLKKWRILESAFGIAELTKTPRESYCSWIFK